MALSAAIEAALVARNLRNMQVARDALAPGYYLRAAQMLRDIRGPVIIGTGFPVNGTFETDGPVGAIALYDALEKLGAEPWLACGPPLSQCLLDDYRLIELRARSMEAAAVEATNRLEQLQPSAVISIERPGLSADGCYYNMRGEDISSRSAIFDPYITAAECPTIAIGDGGNEIGMGNIRAAIASLDINVAETGCDELLVADVSNWGAYGLIALLGLWRQRDLLAEVFPLEILHYLSAHGSVDGVTRENTLTEDGLDAAEGQQVIDELRILTGFLQSGINQ
ncbi:glutamate cyclase domain-containing protein [Seongchinamella unica]|nr:glutamate cyclase domain-containing protein [Seongchinamella unica]